MAQPLATPDDFIAVAPEGTAPPPSSGEPPVETAPLPGPQPDPEPLPAQTAPDEDEPAPAAAAAPASAPAAPGRNPDGTFKGAGDPERRRTSRHDQQARLEELAYEKGEAQRENARLRAQLEAAQRPAAAAPAETSKQAWERIKALPGAPRSSDFADYDDFTIAATDFVAAHRNAELLQSLQQQQSHQRAQYVEAQRFEGYAARMDAALKAAPTFLDTISPEVLRLKPFSRLEPGERPGPLNALAEEIIDSPQSAALMRYFSDHPDDLQRFATLRPRELTREFARIEARLDAAPPGSASGVSPISQAHPPIQPVSGAPPLHDDGTPGDGASFDEHLRDYARRTKAPLPKRRL